MNGSGYGVGFLRILNKKLNYMTKEEVYEKVMGHKPDKRFGIKGSFSWNDISELMDEAVKNCSIPNVVLSLPDYEYEMLIDDEGTPFEINSWIPIATDRIKDPSRIDEYIAKGLIRKRQ